jgi:hypothetical protein
VRKPLQAILQYTRQQGTTCHQHEPRCHQNGRPHAQREKQNRLVTPSVRFAMFVRCRNHTAGSLPRASRKKQKTYGRSCSTTWKLHASRADSIGATVESPRTGTRVLVSFRTFLCQPGVLAWLARLLRRLSLHRSCPSEWDSVVHIAR